MNTASAIVEILKREGTEFLSCFPATSLIEAAAKADLRPLICRQERMGIAIADGFSRTTNGKRIGVFAMQQGPGAENAFPGVAQAYAESVPILLLPAGESLRRFDIAPSFSSTRSYASVAKWVAQANFPDRIPELLRRAFYFLRTGRPGPVAIEVPRDVMVAEFDGDLESYLPIKGNRSGADPADVREAARALLASKVPVIQAGQGVLYAEAWDELRQLAELLQAPVMSTLSAKSVFPENHPLSLGTGSRAVTGHLHHFLQKTDTVFGIGCSFTKTIFGVEIPTGKAMIHSTNDGADINKDYRADYAMVGDAKLVLTQLIEEVRRQAGASDPSQGRKTAEEVKAVKDEWMKGWMPKLTSDETPLSPYRIIWDLMHTVDRQNTIVTHDAGSPRDQMTPFYETTAPRTYIGWGKSTQLGYGLGLAMGAKMAEPDKVCINIMGDAAIGMVGMDFETAARNRIPILTIVLNNGAMSIEVPTFPVATEKFGAKYMYGNYSEVAKALGGYGERVEKPDEIVPTIKRAIEVTRNGQPALLEFITKEERDFSLFA